MSLQDRIAEIQREQEIIRARLEEISVAETPEGDEEVVRAALQERSDEIDDLTARYDELDEELGPLLERAQKLRSVLDAARDPARVEAGDGRYLGGSGPYFNPQKDPFDGDPTTLPRQEVISRAMTVLDRERHVYVPDDSKAQIETFLKRSGSKEEEGVFQLDGSYIARRMLLTENDAYRSAFMKYVRMGSLAAYSPEEQTAVARYQDYEVKRAMGEVNGSTGGFGVPVIIDPSIILTSGAADVPLLRYCRIETVTNNLWKGVSSAGMTWAYTTEATESTDQSPTLVQPEVAIHMARGLVPYSIEVNQDYPGFASEIGALLNQGYNDLLATKTMTGSGVGEPFGLFTHLASIGASQVTLTSDGVFQGADVFKVWNALPERFRANATWVMSTVVQSAIRQFAATQSSTSAYFTIDLTGGTFRINERPVILTDYAPQGVNGQVPGTTGAANVLAVGDWRQAYLWVNRAGMSVEQIPHLWGPTNRLPTGQRALFAWARNGGGLVASNGGRILLNT